MSGALLPDTARAPDGRLHVGGLAAAQLADEFGTPLYVYDEETLRTGARAYVDALADARGGGRAHFAAKAASAPAILRVLRESGMAVDVASAGEIAAARAAGFAGADMVVHGNAKSGADLAAALDARAGLIALDSADEAEALAGLARRRGVPDVPVLVRLRPDLDVTTHEKIATGHARSKFGLPRAGVVALARALPRPLRLVGLHAHLGSQVGDPRQLRGALGAILAVAGDLPSPVEVLDLGGGLGVPYRPDDPAPDPGRYAREVVEAVNRLPDPPHLILEPGRSVAARAAVTLYRVLSVKRDAAGTAWVNVDGGMGDNPRPALYGARYEFFLADRVGRRPDGRYSIGGHHCESGDQLGRDVPLPAPAPGDVLVTPVTGAYHQSMASTYNLFGRPAAVMVRRGEARLVTRRETIDDLLARECA